MKPRSIGIRFSDNDFVTAIRAWLDMLGQQGLKNYGELTKERIAKLFNKSIGGFYWMCQNCLRYDLDWKPETYLVITEADIYLDDEVKEYIANNRPDLNMEFNTIDVWHDGAYYVNTY